MKRGSPLKRTGFAQKPRKRLRPVTRDTAKRKRDATRKWGPDGYREWLRARGCVLARLTDPRWNFHRCADQPVEIAHLRTRGAGNGYVDADGRPNLLPLCPHMHRQSEGRATLFGVQNGVDLWELAAYERRVWEASR